MILHYFVGILKTLIEGGHVMRGTTIYLQDGVVAKSFGSGTSEDPMSWRLFGKEHTHANVSATIKKPLCSCCSAQHRKLHTGPLRRVKEFNEDLCTSIVQKTIPENLRLSWKNTNTNTQSILTRLKHLSKEMIGKLSYLMCCKLTIYAKD